MPLDRAATLRNAEQLLRQGKLGPAIAEYLRVVEDKPRDWTTANALGDVYVRAGQIDEAIAQFTRIADGVADQGFLPRAGALYKKVLRLKPDDERTLLKCADIAISQGLLADARTHLSAMLDQRSRRGDAEGAAQIRLRLEALDPQARSALPETIEPPVEDRSVAVSESPQTEVEASPSVPERAMAETIETAGDAVSAPDETASGVRELEEWIDVPELAESTPSVVELFEMPSAMSEIEDSEREYFDLSVTTIDPASLLNELDSRPPTAHATSASVEVDLSIVLEEAAGTFGEGPAPAGLDEVFENLRGEAGRRPDLAGAEGQYRRALVLREAGDVEGCLGALQLASRSPALRFAAASLAGRLLRETGRTAQAIESFELAAHSPASSSDEAFDVLYELADCLEAAGEGARALAVLLELQMETGHDAQGTRDSRLTGYRDVDARISRLTKVQARG